MSKKIALKDLCAALDKKDRGFYDRLSDEQRKEFSGFMALRYASLVKGIPDLEAYYLLSANTHANKKFFDIESKHQKLQWLVATTVSPGMGVYFHEWIQTPKTVKKANNKKIETLKSLFPTWKMNDIETFASTLTEKEFKDFLNGFGLTD